MKFFPHDIYHVYNQGNNRQSIFRHKTDYEYFLEFSQSYLLPYCNVVAWNLLPNHFHFMLEANEKCKELVKQGNVILDPLSNGFRKLLSAYTHQFNKKYKRSGSLFRPKTKAKNLSIVPPGHYSPNDYYLNCFCYVHQNAVRHRLVESVDKWPFSSYHFYAGRIHEDLCSVEAARRICGYTPETFVRLIHENVPMEFAELFSIVKDS
jgi:REP element-mobilizing transposase RayT